MFGYLSRPELFEDPLTADRRAKLRRLQHALVSGTDPGGIRDAKFLLKTMEHQRIDWPGRAPGGTGDTGLLSNDARGWDAMLKEQKDLEDLRRIFSGKAPTTVEGRYNADSFPEPQVVRGLRSRNADMENQTAMAQAEGGRPQEDDILYNWRQKQARAEMEAETEKANLAAIEARMKAADAGNPALAEAKRAATVRDFAMRRDLPTVRGIARIRPVPSHEPSRATGIERRTPPTQRGIAVVRPGAITQLRQEAEMGRDPNFEASIRTRRAEASTDPAVLAAEARSRRQIVRSSSVNAAGEPVTRVQDIDTGELLAEIPVGPTANMRNFEYNSAKAIPVFNALAELSEKINQAHGPLAKVEGGARRMAALANTDDDVAEYLSIVSAYTPRVARALGHTGVLTQIDVDSVKAMFPAPGDSKSLRDRKVARMLSLFTATGSNEEPGANANIVSIEEVP